MGLRQKSPDKSSCGLPKIRQMGGLWVSQLYLTVQLMAAVAFLSAMALVVLQKGFVVRNIPSTPARHSPRASIPFYIYDDDQMGMAEVQSCPGWKERDEPDLKFFDVMRKHKWRVIDPHQARVHIIPIPLMSSYKYNDRECGGTHIDRVSRAFDRLFHSPTYRQYNFSHYLHCHHWRCFNAWLPDPSLFPTDLFLKGNLSTIMVGRYERYLTTKADCKRYGDDFNICQGLNQVQQLKQRYPSTGYLHHTWEVTRCAIVVPYDTYPSITFVQPSFEAWKRRRHTVFYRTRPSPSAWNASAIRHAPIKGELHKLPDVHVGFGNLPTSEYNATLQQSKFCLVIRGDTPTSHALYNAIKVGCIPVIVSDTFSLVGEPFSHQLPWSLFTIRLPERAFLADPLGVTRFLWQLPEAHLRTLLTNLVDYAQPALLYMQNGYIGDYVLRQLVDECLQ